MVYNKIHGLFIWHKYYYTGSSCPSICGTIDVLFAHGYAFDGNGIIRNNFHIRCFCLHNLHWLHEWHGTLQHWIHPTMDLHCFSPSQVSLVYTHVSLFLSFIPLLPFPNILGFLFIKVVMFTGFTLGIILSFEQIIHFLFHCMITSMERSISLLMMFMKLHSQDKKSHLMLFI